MKNIMSPSIGVQQKYRNYTNYEDLRQFLTQFVVIYRDTPLPPAERQWQKAASRREVPGGLGPSSVPELSNKGQTIHCP